MNRNQQPTVARRTERLVVRQFDDETVVYDLTTEKVTSLDAATASVWQAAEAGSTIPGLAAAIGMSNEDVAVAVVKLDDAGLLENADGSGVSRRLLLKRIGLVTAGVVALPVVTAAPAWAACSGQTATVTATRTGCNDVGSGNPKVIARVQLTITLSGLAPGTYTVTISYVNELGTSTTKNVTVTIPTGACTGQQTTSIDVRRAPTGGQTIQLTAKGPSPATATVATGSATIAAC